ncbi:hypothetical protein K449DRAFT_439773 [Hypoxylon sp. EC38]|nr:hypothetical protein K449DRAFT_439773 [Hypoxylon sp. EC38]
MRSRTDPLVRQALPSEALMLFLSFTGVILHIRHSPPGPIPSSKHDPPIPDLESKSYPSLCSYQFCGVTGTGSLNRFYVIVTETAVPVFWYVVSAISTSTRLLYRCGLPGSRISNHENEELRFNASEER